VAPSDSFQTRTARTGMSDEEIRTFVGDFVEALVRLALERINAVDASTETWTESFDRIAGTLDWSDRQVLGRGGINPNWVDLDAHPHRTLMHPDFVESPAKWPFVSNYVAVSMLSEKQAKVLIPDLVKRRRPNVDVRVLLQEAAVLNSYLRLVQEAGLTGARIMEYRGDLRTHGQGQNDSGAIGALGGAVAIRDAIEEIKPGAILDVHGTMPPQGLPSTPADLVNLMMEPGFQMPRALLLDSHRAVVFSSDPDVAIITRIGGMGGYASAQEAYEEWLNSRRLPAEERQATMHQAALGEVKTALDVSNMHERLALGSRETREEAGAIRFLLMAILTTDIVDPEREGRRAMYSRDAQRFQHVFNLYFVWGYDDARLTHARHWQDFKAELARWCGLT
jgi:hypothetical protein